MADIERAYEHRLYYLAISLSLAVPDICSSLEADLDPNKKWPGVEDRYTGWCKKWLQPRFHVFSATDCWVLRGGVLHNGTMRGRPNSRYNRIIFMISEPPAIVYHENYAANVGGSAEKILQLDTGRFCKAVTASARAWFDACKNDKLVVANLPNLVRYREDGYPPHFSGMPVIA